MRFFYKVMSVILTIYLILVGFIGSTFIHLYTCYVINISYGLFWGMVGFFCPIISEIIMFFLYLIFYGLFNEYCIILLVYLLLIILGLILSYITNYLDEKIKESDNYKNEEKIMDNPERLQKAIDRKEEIDETYFLGKENPYTGKIIETNEDILEYLVQYQKDLNGIDPLS